MMKIDARNNRAKAGPINGCSASDNRKHPITTQALYFLYCTIPCGICSDILFLGLII